MYDVGLEADPRELKSYFAATAAMRSLMNDSNSARRGAIAEVSEYSCETASIVFRPLPVMQATVVSFGPIYPCSISFLVTPVVTPPAVSAKIPSVSAKSWMPLTISGSETSSAQPPLSRIAREA